MLIRVMSDIHNEFCHEQSGSDYLVPELDDDKDSTLILAGDIGLLNRNQPVLIAPMIGIVDVIRKL